VCACRGKKIEEDHREEKAAGKSVRRFEKLRHGLLTFFSLFDAATRRRIIINHDEVNAAPVAFTNVDRSSARLHCEWRGIEFAKLTAPSTQRGS